MMATHLLRDRAPCRLLVPESGAPAVKKVIHKGRKAQKTADGEAFLLPCSLFTCQLGSLSAGLVRKPWGHGPMDEDLCFGVPRGAMGRDHGALSPWGRVPKVDMKRDFFFMEWRSILLLSSFKGIPEGWIVQGAVHR